MLQGWTRILVMTAIAFVVTFLLHVAMEWTVHTYSLGNEITEGLLSSTIAGILVFHICLLRHRRRQKYQRRLDAVVTLNHHVRNALQIMMPFSAGYLPTPSKDLDHAIARIEQVLRDVEPELMQPEAEFGSRAMPCSLITDRARGAEERKGPVRA